MKKKILQCILIIIVLCMSIGCTDTLKKQEVDITDSYMYHNKEYGFKLEIPEREYNVFLIFVEKKEAPDGTTSYGFAFIKRDEDFPEAPYISGRVFQIIVCNGDEVYPESEVLGSKEDKIFCFLADKAPTEDTGFDKLLEELEPMLQEVKESFKFE